MKDIENDFEIHVADRDVTTGTIPIAWCVSKGKLKELARDGVKDPQVVLVIAPEENYHIKKEHRKVIPLKDLIAYVDFRHPGDNRVYAFLSFKGKKDARDTYLSKEKGEYETHVLNSDGDDFKKDFADLSHTHAIYVYVPRECFAPEPPQWEKDWTNHWFRSKPIDQCHYRRRRILAYTVQPIVMLLNVLLRTVLFTLCLLVGARGLVEWKRTFKVLTYGLKDSLEMMSGGSVFIRNVPTPTSDSAWKFFLWLVRSGWTMIFMPLIAIPLAFVFTTYGFVNIMAGAGRFLLMLLGIFTLIGVIALIAYLLIKSGIFTALGRAIDAKLSKRREELRNQKLWYEYENEVALLVCDGKKKTTKVGKLPCKHRTIKLRFQQLKSAVCRPFSG